MKEQEKLTREDLRSLEPNKTRGFQLKDAKAIESAKALTYQMQPLLGCKFTVSTDYPERTIYITRLPL